MRMLIYPCLEVVSDWLARRRARKERRQQRRQRRWFMM